MTGAQQGEAKEERHWSDSEQQPQASIGDKAKISRAFHIRDRFAFITLYQQYVRPHLELAMQAWCLWAQQDWDARCRSIKEKGTGEAGSDNVGGEETSSRHVAGD